MTETQAVAVAATFGGHVWNSGGGMYLVIFRRTEGRVVAISSESMCLYAEAKAQPLPAAGPRGIHAVRVSVSLRF